MSEGELVTKVFYYKLPEDEQVRINTNLLRISKSLAANNGAYSMSDMAYVNQQLVQCLARMSQFSKEHKHRVAEYQTKLDATQLDMERVFSALQNMTNGQNIVVDRFKDKDKSAQGISDLAFLLKQASQEFPNYPPIFKKHAGNRETMCRMKGCERAIAKVASKTMSTDASTLKDVIGGCIICENVEDVNKVFKTIRADQDLEWSEIRETFTKGKGWQDVKLFFRKKGSMVWVELQLVLGMFQAIRDGASHKVYEHVREAATILLSNQSGKKPEYILVRENKMKEIMGRGRSKANIAACKLLKAEIKTAEPICAKITQLEADAEKAFQDMEFDDAEKFEDEIIVLKAQLQRGIAGSSMPKELVMDASMPSLNLDDARWFFQSTGGSLPNMSFPGLQLISCDKGYPIFMINNFLSSEEVRKVLALSSGEFTPSTFGKASNVETVRSSENILLSHPETVSLRKRVAEVLQHNYDAMSSGKLIRYVQGQQFTRHLDFHDKKPEEYVKKSMPPTTQREWSFFIYLNDVEEGGETQFFRDTVPYLKVPPKAGRAIFFPVSAVKPPKGSADRDLFEKGDFTAMKTAAKTSTEWKFVKATNPEGKLANNDWVVSCCDKRYILAHQSSKHAGLPVLKGEKYLLNFWPVNVPPEHIETLKSMGTGANIIKSRKGGSRDCLA